MKKKIDIFVLNKKEMKRISLILITTLISISVFSQTSVPERKNNASDPHIIDRPEYRHFWGSAADSCVESSSINFYFSFTAPGWQTCTFYPYITKVSGTVTGEISFYESGKSYPYSWTKIDSIQVTNVSTGELDKKVIDFKGQYLRVEYASSASDQKSLLKVPYVTKY